MSALRDAIVTHLQANATVTALATGGIYPGLPPEGAETFPFITVLPFKAVKPQKAFRGGGTVTDEVVFEEAIYTVKAIDRGISGDSVADIVSAVRTALDGATPTMTGYTAINLEWIGDIPEYSELANSQHYQHQGAQFRIWAKTT